MTAAWQSFSDAGGTLGADPVVNKPSGTVDGDLLIAVGVVASGGSMTAPAGWTTASSSQGPSGPMWTKIASSEPATYTFVTSGAASSAVVIARVNGQAASSPLDVQSGTVTSNGTTNVVIPSVTPTGGNRLLMQICARAVACTWTPPGTATEQWDHQAASSSFGTAGGTETVGASATGSRTWVPSSSTAIAVGYMIAVKPATVDYTVSSDLVGDGVAARDGFAVTESKSLTGDGVTTRQLGETTVRDLTGDGVLTRTLFGTVARDLTGDGVITRGLDVVLARDLTGSGLITETNPSAYGRSFDLVGDGTVDATKNVAASKTFDLVGEGTVTESQGRGLSRSFDLTGDGTISGSADIPFPDIPECAPDWSPNDGLKAIAGTVLFHEPPNQGDPVSGATVCLFRDVDGVRIECTTTAADGTYTFGRDTNDPYTYHVEVNYENAGVKQQGLSEGGCVPQ